MVTPGTFIEGKPAGGDLIEIPMTALGADEPMGPFGLKQVIHTDIFRMKTILKLIQAQRIHE